jgi:hypothetical protein
MQKVLIPKPEMIVLNIAQGRSYGPATLDSCPSSPSSCMEVLHHHVHKGYEQTEDMCSVFLPGK